MATKPRSLTKQTRPSRFSCQLLSNLWQLNLIALGSFRVLMPIFLNSAATKPGHLGTIPGSHAELSFFNCHSKWQLNQGQHSTLQVLMPTSLYLSLQSPGMTPGSVAPRTARSVRPVSQLQPDQPVEMYFFLITFNMDLCSTLPSSPSHS